MNRKPIPKTDNKNRRLPSQEEIASFREEIYGYYKKSGRDLPWRNAITPYRVVVSEVMLQQTQVERVSGKYEDFISRFPDFDSLARADLRDLLQAWQGLGYNRRALALAKLARKVVAEHRGELPPDIETLSTLPGIGKATAGSIAAFAFNLPSVFLETNIRRVFSHFFFRDHTGVHDREILRLIEASLDRVNPRRWYYALMDYGAMLKKTVENPNRRSAHYTRQSPFGDSDRKVRGAILRILLAGKPLAGGEVAEALREEPGRVGRILAQLRDEGFVREDGGCYRIA